MWCILEPCAGRVAGSILKKVRAGILCSYTFSMVRAGAVRVRADFLPQNAGAGSISQPAQGPSVDVLFIFNPSHLLSDSFENIFMKIEKYFIESCSEGPNNQFLLHLSIQSLH